MPQQMGLLRYTLGTPPKYMCLRASIVLLCERRSIVRTIGAAIMLLIARSYVLACERRSIVRTIGAAIMLLACALAARTALTTRSSTLACYILRDCYYTLQ